MGEPQKDVLMTRRHFLKTVGHLFVATAAATMFPQPPLSPKVNKHEAVEKINKHAKVVEITDNLVRVK